MYLKYPKYHLHLKDLMNLSYLLFLGDLGILFVLKCLMNHLYLIIPKNLTYLKNRLNLKFPKNLMNH